MLLQPGDDMFNIGQIYFEGGQDQNFMDQEF